MTQSGENKSNSGTARTAEERMSVLDKVLETYTKSVGLRDNSQVHEADKYLNLSRDDLKGMEAAELNEAYYILQRYAMFVQRCQNREKSHVIWANDTLSGSVIGEVDAFKTGNKYSSYEERKLKAIAASAFAKKLNHLRMLAEIRVQELDYLATSIYRIAQAILEVRNGKQAKA